MAKATSALVQILWIDYLTMAYRTQTNEVGDGAPLPISNAPRGGRETRPLQASYYDATIAARGILILLIVLGHNREIDSQVPYLFNFLYKWHVHGFFFLALSARGLSSRPRPISDTLARFFVPFLFFLSAATALNALRADVSITDYLAAVSIGSGRLVNAACDMSLFWFLPAFAGFLIAIAMISRTALRSSFPRATVVAICTVLIIAAYFYPRDAALYTPFGLVVSLYLIPGSVLYSLLIWCAERSDKANAATLVASALIFGYCSYGLADQHFDISLFKFGQREPLQFIAGLTLSITGCATVYLACKIIRKTRLFDGLRRIGEASFSIFLIHSFIQAPAILIMTKVMPEQAASAKLVLAGLIYLLSILVSILIHGFLQKHTALRSLFLPDDLSDFRATWRHHALNLGRR